MTRLVLLAHGSNDPVWCATFERLLRTVASDLGSERVRLSYMQFARPTVEDVAQEASRDQVKTLKFLPIFLSAGGHVSHDLPRLIEKARDCYPDMKIDLLDPVGESEAFARLVSHCAHQALEQTGER